MQRRTVLKSRRAASAVPTFSLYGEQNVGPAKLHIEDIQIRSRRYQWDISSHAHRTLMQLVIVLAGPVDIRLDEQRLAGHSPLMVVVPAGVVHSFQFGPDTLGYVLTLNAHWFGKQELELAQAYQSLFAEPVVVPFAGEDVGAMRIDVLLAELMHEFRKPDGPLSPVTGWLMRSVIWRLAQHLVTAGFGQAVARAPGDAVFLRFRALLEEHFIEHWQVGQYAKELAMSVERLNRLSEQRTGKSAFALTQERVLREACRRLVYVVMPVSQLAYELGFADAGYFCRFFRRHTDMSPNQYRKKHGGVDLEAE